MTPIGYATTCFKEKFGIPRQSGLCPHAWGIISLNPPYNRAEALKGLETFSHMIITFSPHANGPSEALTVRPPRLGGNKKLGVFATRSPFRPNPICTSIVKLDEINFDTGEVKFSNHDLLDQTPIWDIKPYIPQWDCIDSARAGWIEEFPDQKNLTVIFAEDFNIAENLKHIIQEVLALDPTPRYPSPKRAYAFLIEDYDVHFRLGDKEKIEVFKIEKKGNH